MSHDKLNIDFVSKRDRTPPSLWRRGFCVNLKLYILGIDKGGAEAYNKIVECRTYNELEVEAWKKTI